MSATTSRTTSSTPLTADVEIPLLDVAAPEALPAAAPDADAATRGGLWLAMLSAVAFASTGSFAKGLLGAGWTSGSAVLARIAGAALVLAVPAAWSLRGRWRVLPDNAGIILAYGVVAVACSQLFYFNAIAHMSVGVALLLEYFSPVLLVGLLWARTRRRPAAATLLGAVLAMGGLALVINLFGGISIDLVGLAWGLAAAFCAVGYYVLGARQTRGLPPIALAWGGMVVAAAALALAGALGVTPMTFSTDDVVLAGADVPVWAPLAGLALVSGAVAYGAGIAATRRLGSTVASFVALTEVLFAIVIAYLLLGEVPTSGQVMGGLLVLVGVVAVKFGESRA